jgi:hypothetical protein
MTLLMPSFLVKRSSGADNLLLFLITSAASVLCTRVFLYIFNYPQIATGGLHIAHAIFGGLFLTASVVLLLSFHGRRVRQMAAIMAGWGFGQFIDEVGKFITRENNYFYQPVPVIIYLSFIFLFFLYRRLDRYTPKDARELSYDLIEKLEDMADNRFFQQHREQIEDLVTKILNTPESGYHWFAESIRKLVGGLPILPNPQRGRVVGRLQNSWKWLDDFTAERKPVFYILLGLFLIYVMLTFWTMSVFLYRLGGENFDPSGIGFTTRIEWYVYVAEVISQVISALWMCQGFWWLIRRQRRKALILFKNGLAINILVTHVFAFYIEQFSAVTTLLGMIILFAIVDNILQEYEQNIAKK